MAYATRMRTPACGIDQRPLQAAGGDHRLGVTGAAASAAAPR
jgi:hypothetical protein